MLSQLLEKKNVVSADELATAASLQHRDGDRVGDHVVELTGDPGALLGDGNAGLFLEHRVAGSQKA